MGERLLESGQVVAARYTLLRKLGAGRAADVWLAHDVVNDREVALKLLVGETSDAERDAFLRTAALQQRIEHPNVLHCDAHGADDVPHAVFEYLARGDLSQSRGRPWRELVPLLGGIAAGGGALHAAGIVHRDLKPSNVLLGADGTPKLADLGLAAEVGSASADVAGSPFSASPQQLAGEPPSIADDIHGFGALCYELLSGYPPRYPDAEAARTRREPPAPLAATLALPPRLDALVMSCLADAPGDRPADFATIRSTLRGIANEAAGHVPVPQAAPVSLRAPQASVAGIEPQWRRARATAPDPAQLRAQGFRRGVLAAAFALLAVGAVVVFVGLPRWVAKPVTAGAPAPVAEPVTPASPPERTEADLRRLAEVKLAYDELHPDVAGRRQALEGRHAADWGGDTWTRGNEAFAAAEAAYAQRDYDPALEKLEAADADFKAVDRSAGEKLRAALSAGATALQTGTADDARAQFELALRIDANNAVAKRGLQRAATLDEVRRLLADGAAQEQAGDRTAAEQSYRAALKLDAQASDASAGLARLQSAAASGAFSAAVAEGLAALSRRDPVAARTAFQRANAIRPGSPEVRDGLAQVDRELGDQSIAEHLAGAQAAETQERWSDALAEFRKALAIDPNLLAAQQGLERTEPRAMLDAELRSYLGRPERLFTTEVRTAARNTIDRARRITPRGAVLDGQIAQIDGLVAAAEQPITLALQSDNVTDVTIYRVGRLGTFERRDMTLLPGRYTVIGTRAGYRDVRRELTILPGQLPAPVVVRCEDPI